MKQFLTVILILAYGFSATGMTVSLHYCCGKLEKITLDPQTAQCADHQESDSKRIKPVNCCETKVIATDLQDASPHKTPAKIIAAAFAIPAALGVLQFTAPIVDRQLSPVAFSPPPLPVQRYLLFGVFRI